MTQTRTNTWRWRLLVPVAGLFTLLTTQTSHAYKWYIDIFEPVGVVSDNGRQVHLKFAAKDVDWGQPNQRIVAEVVVYQPHTGAMAVGSWIAPQKAKYNLWVTCHWENEGEATFDEGPVFVFARSKLLEGSRVIDAWEWGAEATLFEVD